MLLPRYLHGILNSNSVCKLPSWKIWIGCGWWHNQLHHIGDFCNHSWPTRRAPPPMPAPSAGCLLGDHDARRHIPSRVAAFPDIYEPNCQHFSDCICPSGRTSTIQLPLGFRSQYTVQVHPVTAICSGSRWGGSNLLAPWIVRIQKGMFQTIGLWSSWSSYVMAHTMSRIEVSQWWWWPRKTNLAALTPPPLTTTPTPIRTTAPVNSAFKCLMLMYIHATLLVQVVFNRSLVALVIWKRVWQGTIWGVPNVLIRGVQCCQNAALHATSTTCSGGGYNDHITSVTCDTGYSESGSVAGGDLGCTLSCEAREQEWLADCACTVDSVDCVAKKNAWTNAGCEPQTCG